MAPYGPPDQASADGEMVWREFLWVPYSHSPKEASVHPKDIISAWTQQFTLSDLPPHLPVAELQPLPEMAKEFHKSEGGQEVSHLLIPGILKLIEIHVQVPHEYGVPPWEAVEFRL